MISLDELKKLRDEAAKKINLRNQKDGFRIVVGMATCGITAGARPILNGLVEEVNKRNLTNVTVTQVGCIGKCSLEPIVEVYDKAGQRVTYCKVKPENINTIIEEHIINNRVVTSLLISNYEV
ncbi:MAG: (2Fe-2S) ferredoxin domain-containing protein [Bacilli bacterium]